MFLGGECFFYSWKGVVVYYCVASDQEGTARECVDKLPRDVKRVDLLALTHSGGMSQLEDIASDLDKMGLKPGLMLSIGCSDPTSTMTEPENTMGQQGTSWAVHFYLSNALSKRLRGSPMDPAAKEAYSEGIVLPTSINPISLGGIIATTYMGEGYKGSKPEVKKMMVVPKAKKAKKAK